MADTVEEYILAQSPPLQDCLQRLRAIIRAEVLEAEELISYKIPCAG